MSLRTQPVSGAFSRSVTASSESINTTIDSMKLPFENELKRYVVADAENIGGLIDDMTTMLDNLKDLNMSAATTLLDPSIYNVAYTSTLLTNITSEVTTNLADSGTGLPTATETAMYERRRARRRFEASRTSRRITEQISKNLPYAGMMADKLTEADQDTQNAMTELEDWITEQQGLMTYKFQRDKVREAQSLETFKVTEKHNRLAQHLQAMISDDANIVLQRWKEYELEIRQYLSHVQVGIGFALQAAGGADQITFGNWKAMATMMAEGELRIAGLISNLMPGGSLT